MARSSSALAWALSLGSLLGCAAADDFQSVLTATENYYADGAIYRSSSTNLGNFPAQTIFPLTMAVTSHPTGPLHPIQPAQPIGDQTYQALDSFLYINAAPGAFQPVGFVEKSNASLASGETTWGFYDGYGFFMWYNPAVDPRASNRRRQESGQGSAGLDRKLGRRHPSLAARRPVHAQGFQWVPVPSGYGDLTQLYWNQTQFDLAATMGSASGVDPNKASFGMTTSNVDATILPAV